MKKLFAFLLLALSLTGICAYAEGTFGELSYKADGGLYLFSEGGNHEADSFGFAFSGGEKTVHVYMVGCDFSQPFCAALKGLSEKELEVRQFICSGEDFLYDVPVYITLKDNKLTAKTLDQKKAEAVSSLESAVDISLYREAERLSIEKILLDAEGEINALKRAYGIEGVVNEAKTRISALKTDEQLYAEELAALKADKISVLGSYLDKSLYRQAEQLKIDELVLLFAETINEAVTKEAVSDAEGKAKASLDAIPTDAKCKENAALNDEVIGHLDDALDELDGISGLTTKGKILKDIKIIPVVEAVIEDGKYGRMYITRENIKLAYPDEVADVKDYFYNPSGAIDKMNDGDRTIFENKVGEMSMTVISFLKEYFL